MGDTKVRPLCTHRKNDQSEDIKASWHWSRHVPQGVKAIALFNFAELGTTHL